MVGCRVGCGPDSGVGPTDGPGSSLKMCLPISTLALCFMWWITSVSWALLDLKSSTWLFLGSPHLHRCGVNRTVDAVTIHELEGFVDLGSIFTLK